MLFAVALVLPAQPVRVSGVLCGFVFDEAAGAIRPIYGAPGAAYVGEPLVSGLEWASIAPEGRAALVWNGGALRALMGLDVLQPWSQPVENASVRPDKAAWSEGALVAVVYASRTGMAQVIKNEAGRWVAGETLPLGEEVGALAVDPQGRVIAALPGGIYLFASGQSPLLLSAAGEGAAMQVAGGRLFIAVPGADLIEVEDYAGKAAALRLGPAPAGAGLALAVDGGRLLVTCRSERVVEVYDLATRASLLRLPLDSEPSTLEKLTADGTWLVRGMLSAFEPLLVFRAAPEPGLWFVPVGKGE